MKHSILETVIRQSRDSDMPFLWKMLYEAIFWRDIVHRPDYDEAMELDYVKIALEDWGERRGDTALVAESEGSPVGAGWFRYWSEDDDMRGYIREDVPVLAIAVHEDFRRKGIGRLLIDGLMNRAAEQSIGEVSLCVSKDNHARGLYLATGFRIHADIGDSELMIRGSGG